MQQPVVFQNYKVITISGAVDFFTERTIGVICAIGVIVLFSSFFIPGKAILLADLHSLALQAVSHGLLIGVLSIFIYTKAASALGAAETALFTAAVPCITTLAAIPLLSEIPSVVSLVGLIIVT